MEPKSSLINRLLAAISAPTARKLRILALLGFAPTRNEMTGRIVALRWGGIR